MADTAKAKKANLIKKTLSKRIDVTANKKLSRDVHAPKWLRAIGAYFAGAYTELRQVQWPNRRQSWGFTLAVMIFTVSLALLIVGLDYGFEQLFKKVLLK